MMKENRFVLSMVAFSLMGVSGISQAGVSANLGIASQYYFRGVQQTTGAAAQGGIDYAHDTGLYAGLWGSNVGGHEVADQSPASTDDDPLGIEVDYYLGYKGELKDFSYGIGYTLYTYTGDFDTEYSEVNLTAGYSMFGLEFSSGTHDVIGGPDQDYTFTALTFEYMDITATYGAWGSDLDGTYFEIGFAREISEIEFGISLINGDAEANAKNVATDGTALVITIGKEFDL
ncbi:hypothetical protein MNBD_GAMMA10-2252 [hydrothermal vent metagenome]|uniref:Uncharacterized protein n=1 Tax=hydrothermal vent metagenome TaxID=652676 RepID=A0A3B0YIL9_9ZZZZ